MQYLCNFLFSKKLYCYYKNKEDLVVKKILLVGFVFTVLALAPYSAFASDKPQRGEISWKSGGACALSLLIWPGLGQAVNDQKEGKIVTHAVSGLFPPFRFWSAYDALFDRSGGYWHGRV
jgi:hypothetical protein